GAYRFGSAFHELRPELHLFGNLLEQPSPSSSHGHPGRRPHSLDQFFSAVLPFSRSGFDSLDGRESFGADTNRRLRRGAADAGHRVLFAAEDYCAKARFTFRACERAWI